MLSLAYRAIAQKNLGAHGAGAVDATCSFEQNNRVPSEASFLDELLTYAMDLLQKLTAIPTLLGQAAAPAVNSNAEHWLVKWASPFFLIGVGILAGMILLGLAVLLIKVLSQIGPWEKLSHTSAGHVVGALLTAVIAGLAISLIHVYSFNGGESASERWMIYFSVGLLSAILGWGLVFCAGQKSASTLLATLSEGASLILGVIVLMVMVLGLLAGLIFTQPESALKSVPRLFQTGTREYVFDIPAMPANVELDQAPLTEVPFEFEYQLLTGFNVQSTTTVDLADAGNSTDFQESPRRLSANENLAWNRREGKTPPVFLNPDRHLFVRNNEVVDGKLTVTIMTAPAMPEASTILISMVVVFLTGMAILLQQAVAPRASAVALATIKNEIAQPLFLVLTIIGTFLIVLFVFLSFYTFGEDIKLLKECGIVVIMLLAAFQGIWSASSSISEEIEGRTALTVLSKPIQRRSFVLGKFLGIFWVVALLFVILGTVELAAVAYKPIYESRENSLEMPSWQDCHREMAATVPGLVLGLMQATILSTFSVALATRLPQLANIAVCFAIYVVGHLATAIVSGANEGFPIVKFVAQLVATVTPILEHFSMQAAIDAGSPIPMSLLAGTLLYCVLYMVLSMFLALLLFEDRDLA